MFSVEDELPLLMMSFIQRSEIFQATRTMRKLDAFVDKWGKVSRNG
jgi:hypothetical protein